MVREGTRSTALCPDARAPRLGGAGPSDWNRGRRNGWCTTTPTLVQVGPRNSGGAPTLPLLRRGVAGRRARHDPQSRFVRGIYSDDLLRSPPIRAVRFARCAPHWSACPRGSTVLRSQQGAVREVRLAHHALVALRSVLLPGGVAGRARR